MTTTTKLNTPDEIRSPYPGTEDCGLEMVHSLGGSPSHYLHTVTCGEEDWQSCRMLHADEYKQSHGFIRDGKQMWVFLKRFPLSVSEWC